jgi:hypothetical protein
VTSDDATVIAQRMIPPHRWAIVGSWVTVRFHHPRRVLSGRVCEIDGDALAVDTEIGLIRVRRADCRPGRRADHGLGDAATGVNRRTGPAAADPETAH